MKCRIIINIIIQYYQQFKREKYIQNSNVQIYTCGNTTMQEDQPQEMIPRSYQTQLMRIAKKQNSIIYLPTGSGKTYIAILLLKEMIRPLEKAYADGGKIGIMLVNTVPLVEQHKKSLKDTTTLRVNGISGEMNVDFWIKRDWENQCTKYNMFVMTGKILENAIKQRYIDLNRIHLLIFDECHHAVYAHTMREIMKEFEYAPNPPRVLGLTATLINKNVKSCSVLSEVTKLEVSLHSKVTSVDDVNDVVIHSTNPSEYLEMFDIHERTEMEDKVIHIFLALQQTLTECQSKENLKTKQENYRDENLQPLESRGTYKDLNRIVKDTIRHIEMLGTYGGYQAILSHLIQLQCIELRCLDNTVLIILKIMISQFIVAKKLLKEAMKDCDLNMIKIMQHSSPQVMKFLYILDKYSHTTLPLCALVFVKCRFTAQILYHILKKLTICCETYSHIICNYITGTSCNPITNTRIGLYETKVNNGIIKNFTDHKLNLLICTNLMEEGVDIPMCSLVVKFDHPENYRSYIQSKGRTRHKEGNYVIMVSNKLEHKFRSSYETFQRIENELNSQLVNSNACNRPGPTSKDIQKMYNELELPTYYVDDNQSAHVTMNDAVALVHTYCNSLPSDQFTRHAPLFFSELHETDGTIRVILEFPLEVGIVDVVMGSYMKTKTKAKQACALEACALLHKMGQLDEHLTPISHCAIDQDTDFLFTHWPKEKENDAGNTKRRRKYTRVVPTCMLNPLPQSLTALYIHVIHIEPVFVPDTTDLPALHFHRMFSNDLCFGLITADPMPNVCSYPLFVSNGEIQITIRTNVQKIELTQMQLDELNIFHHLIFDGVLDILHGFLSMNSDSSMVNLLLAPVDRTTGDIRWNVVHEHKNIKSFETIPSTEERAAMNVTEETYTDSIVSKRYISDSNVYLVIRVTELYPKSQFETTDFDTFNDYFRDRYSMQIENQKQPLLLVKGISKRLNCLKPRTDLSNRKRNHTGQGCNEKKENFNEKLVPEFLVKQDFPAALWIQAKVMPSIIHRLLQMIRAEELRRLIALETGMGNLEIENIQPLLVDKHLIKDPIEKESDTTQSSPEVNMEIDDTNNQLCICGPDKTVKKGRISFNKDVFEKKLDDQYPWNIIEEPTDINRNLNVTAAEIRRYYNFINYKRNKISDRTTKVETNPAITYNKDFCHKHISILGKSLNSQGPDLKDIYQVLASKKCNEVVNLERLETLGDSFLKLASSLYIWLKYPKYCEGKASTLKGKLISNKNLYYCGIQKRLGSLMLVSDLELTNWLPPSFGLLETIRAKLVKNEIQPGSLFHLQLTASEQVSGILTRDSEDALISLNEKELKEDDAPPIDNYIGQQEVADKTIADCVEAILGAYCQSCGFEGGLRMLEWFSIIPSDECLAELLQKPLPSPIVNGNMGLPSDIEDIVDNLVPNWEHIEKKIGYHFNDRAYLLQALTHATYTSNRITRSYERLEFIGDAVLDYLVTMYIYEYGNNLNPGELTDLRSALVNNETFAAFTVRLDLHKSLKYMNPLLQTYISKYAQYMESVNYEVNSSMLSLINDRDVNSAENIDVPKALGDVFESIVGAIYLDCGMDMQKVWTIVYKIMYKEIDLFSACVPKNPVRLIYEKQGAYPKFSRAVQVKDRQQVFVSLEVTVNAEKKTVHGYGANSKLAKKAAAKIALCLFD